MRDLRREKQSLETQVEDYSHSPNTKNTITPTPTPIPNPKCIEPKEEIIETKNYKLTIITTWDNAGIDQKFTLLKNDGSETKTVLYSIKETLPELKKEPGLILNKLAAPKGSDVVFFKSVLNATDNPAGEIYSYNIDKNAFTKMKINEIYSGFFGGFALSPDETRFVWTPDGLENEGDTKTMYFFDLINDSYKASVTLNGNETFNGGMGAMQSYFDIKWPALNKITYSVFDQAKKMTSKDYDPTKNLIANREIDL
ncbi:MAG: hypothetical protein UT60_C0003G0047 [candidate division CPR2 bacterium GW2011_GWD2_39_7]|nr:MAG: hypothetical protein UT60_C0003G0047 [candidate division CPR2 bacterium GW2011_GWD2_39_7]